MPCTRVIDDRYSVSISSHPVRHGGWEAEGDVFVTTTQAATPITVRGEGRTLAAAEEQAVAEARRLCRERRLHRKARRRPGRRP